MKKIYIKPEINVVKIQSVSMMAASTDLTCSGDADGSEVLSREDDNWGEFPWE